MAFRSALSMTLKAASSLLILLGSATAQAAEEPAGEGRRMTVLIGTSPGSTFDLAGRLVSRHMAKFLPGKPNMVPQNMAGAGSVIAANYLSNTAPQDGSVVGVLVPTVVLNQLFKQGNVQFDVAKLQWIGAPSDSPSVIAVWHQAPWTTWEAAKNQPLIIGAPAPTAPDALAAYLVNRTLDAKLKVVLGYLGGKEIEAAMERGEVHARAGQSWAGWGSSNPNWVAEKKVIPILQLGIRPAPDLPGVPALIDLVQGDAKQVVELYAGAMTMDRPMVVGPRVPAEQTALLRAAYKQTMGDPEFLAEAKKVNMQISPVAGEELQAIAERAVAMPPSVIELGAQILKRD